MFKIFFLGALLGLCWHPVISNQKIATLAPGLTEIVFAVGQGDHLIANTIFCDFPEESKKIEKIGGLTDLNIEKLIALKPDLIIAYPEHQDLLKPIAGLKSIVYVPHHTLEDIIQSIQVISAALKSQKQGEAVIREIKKEFAAIQKQTAGCKKVRVLLVAGRNPGHLEQMFIIGKDDFLNQIMELSGGLNVYQGSTPYPQISLESVIYLSPEWIIELSSFYENIPDAEILKFWKKYPILPAVQSNRILIIKENYWLRPGPRIGRIARAISNYRSQND